MSSRKTLFFRRLLAITLAISLFVSWWPAPAFANSREAIVENVEGDVYIRKAGGTKEFIAYKGMVLRKGDRIRTEEHSSLELRTKDSDDLLVVGQNTEIFVSELTDEKKKKSGFKMWTGSVFAKVATLFASDDEYEIETPNAVMGVRGTHFTILIDPETGLPTMFVSSGKVEVSKPNDTTSDDEIVLPAQQVTIFPGADDDPVTLIDPSGIVQHMDPSIISRLLRNLHDIRQENEELFNDIVNDYHEQGYLAPDDENSDVPSEDEIRRLQANIDHMIAHILRQAVDNGVVDEDEINRIIDEVNDQLTQEDEFSLDRDVPPFEDHLGEQSREQKRLLEERRRQQQEQQRREQERREEQQRNNQDLLDRIQKQREEQDKQNRAARDEAEQKVVDNLLDQLSEEERRRFEEAQRKRDEEREQADKERERRQQQAESRGQDRPDTPDEDHNSSYPPPGSNPGTIVQPEIESIEALRVAITAGDDYELPRTMDAKTTSGRTTQVPVNWTPTDVDLSQPGIYEFTSEVSNSDKLAKLIITVQASYDTEVALTKLAQNKLPLAGGVMVDFGDITFAEDATVTVTQTSVTTDMEERGLQPAGAVLQFHFEGVDWSENDHYAELSYPVDEGVSSEQVGMFRFVEHTGDWQYVETLVEQGTAKALVRQFSTFGLFVAEAADTPTISPVSGLVNRGDLFTIHTDDDRAALYYKIGTSWQLYTEPLPITNGWSIAVKAEAANKRTSAAKNVHYTTVHTEASSQKWNEMNLQFSESIALEMIEESSGRVPQITIGQNVYRLAVMSDEGQTVGITEAQMNDGALLLELEQPASGSYEVVFTMDSQVALRTTAVQLTNPDEDTQPSEPEPKAAVVHSGGDGIVEIGDNGLNVQIVLHDLRETYGLQLHLLMDSMLSVAHYNTGAGIALGQPVQFARQFAGLAPASEGDGLRHVHEFVYVMLTDANLQNNWTINEQGETVLDLIITPGAVNFDHGAPDSDGYYSGTIELIELYGVDEAGHPIVIPVQTGIIAFKVHESKLE